ncbi:MAG: hypothetical protein EB059_10635 [Alphaproteobacteria bacterium]|nr:hypothetical protein [Alphaproteobacteria bacterium]
MQWGKLWQRVADTLCDPDGLLDWPVGWLCNQAGVLERRMEKAIYCADSPWLQGTPRDAWRSAMRSVKALLPKPAKTSLML